MPEASAIVLLSSLIFEDYILLLRLVFPSIHLHIQPILFSVVRRLESILTGRYTLDRSDECLKSNMENVAMERCDGPLFQESISVK